MIKDDELMHIGKAHDEDPPGRGSGRYAWGSGDNPGQHQFDYLSEVKCLRNSGIKDSEIAKMLIGPRADASDVRIKETIEKNRFRKEERTRALELLEKHEGNVSAVARDMGKNESSIRTLLNKEISDFQDRYDNTAQIIKSRVDKYGVVDISKGVEHYLGVSDYTKKVATAMLEDEGYKKMYVKVPQVGTGHETSIMVLARSDISFGDIQRDKSLIKPITDFTPDKGETWWVPEYPESIDSSRVFIRYKEDGGAEKDGTIELRPGVKDISLGNSRYAQVRIAVDGTHYMKGMALYSDDIPDGFDVVYNTNKKRGTPGKAKNKGESEVFKRLKINEETGEIDKDNPFGALIRAPKERDGIITAAGQSKYIGDDGKEHLSVINKLQDEGDWDTWSRHLSSQFLSKQPVKLIKQQLDLTVLNKRNELEEIKRLTNPVIKKRLLDDFADQMESDASQLAATGFKNQAFQVILPVPDLPDDEIYAMNYNNGEKVALVRYPHAGTFEIPVLTVNNKNPAAKKALGGALDAVGINAKNAEILSGADFDGDTVIVIPLNSNNLKLQVDKPLAGLKDWDPKTIYKIPDDDTTTKRMTDRMKGIEMGKVTNLITDMTVGGASMQDITKAVKHSMVVIDAVKHNLDYKQSYKDNDILTLKKKYQGINAKGGPKGAATILSRASAPVFIPRRKEITDVKKMTPEQLKRFNAGMRVYVNTGETKIKKVDGEWKKTDELKTFKTNQMSITDDAMTLVRDPSNEKELTYARFANSIKGLEREARRISRSIKPVPVSRSAKETYKEEVNDLMRQLRVAEQNDPRERQALVIKSAIVSEKVKSNPNMSYEHRQREEARAMTEARAIVGAKKTLVEISPRQWEAIQSNAISTNKLAKIVNNTDRERFRQLATPRKIQGLLDYQIDLAKAMAKTGMYTHKEIADKFGVSTSTITRILK